jgi:hypothetical protein
VTSCRPPSDARGRQGPTRPAGPEAARLFGRPRCAASTVGTPNTPRPRRTARDHADGMPSQVQSHRR